MEPIREIYELADRIFGDSEKLKYLIANEFGTLVQIQDVTDGTRRFLSQRRFMTGNEMQVWAAEMRQEFEGRTLQMVQFGSEHFLMQNDTRLARSEVVEQSLRDI